MSTTKKKDPYDTTSSKRQSAHLERLNETQGKRLPVDLSGDHIQKLEDLVDADYGKKEYGSSSAGAIRKAIDDAHKRVMKKL